MLLAVSMAVSETTGVGPRVVVSVTWRCPGCSPYVNGGWTEANFTRTSFLDAVTGGAAGIELPGQRREGWFLGGGTEYAFNFLPGLFLKSEYRFADFGNRNSDLFWDGTLVCGGVAGPVGALDRS